MTRLTREEQDEMLIGDLSPRIPWKWPEIDWQLLIRWEKEEPDAPQT